MELYEAILERTTENRVRLRFRQAMLAIGEIVLREDCVVCVIKCVFVMLVPSIRYIPVLNYKQVNVPLTTRVATCSARPAAFCTIQV